MEQQVQPNPLAQYFRQIKFYTKLPSGTTYYEPNEIKFTDSGEVGILPMAARDEMILKNPDALLNGEALYEVIRSCVPAVNNPRVLLTNDIDTLITAIRYATYNDTLETQLICPNCKHDNLFKLDLQYSLNNMSFLESEYVINLDSGLSVFVKPYSFPDVLSGLHAQFEQSKITRSIEDKNLSDEERLKMFSKAFKEMGTVTSNLMCNSVIKVVDESKNINVNNKDHIRGLLHNIDKVSADKITDLIKEINTIGIKRNFAAKCEKCNHEWDNDIDFNPVNFS